MVDGGAVAPELAQHVAALVADPLDHAPVMAALAKSGAASEDAARVVVSRELEAKHASERLAHVLGAAKADAPQRNVPDPKVQAGTRAEREAHGSEIQQQMMAAISDPSGDMLTTRARAAGGGDARVDALAPPEAYGILGDEARAALKGVDLGLWLEAVDRKKAYGELGNIVRALPDWLAPDRIADHLLTKDQRASGRVLSVRGRSVTADEAQAMAQGMLSRKGELEELLSRPSIYTEEERAARVKQALDWSADFRSQVPIADETGASRLLPRDALSADARPQMDIADMIVVERDGKFERVPEAELQKPPRAADLADLVKACKD